MPNTLFVTFKLDQLGEPREYWPPADRVLEGDIVCRSWEVDSAKDGKVRASVFESTPGVNRSMQLGEWLLSIGLQQAGDATTMVLDRRRRRPGRHACSRWPSSRSIEDIELP